MILLTCPISTELYVNLFSCFIYFNLLNLFLTCFCQVDGCNIRVMWNNKVPCIIAFGSEAYDCRVRCVNAGAFALIWLRYQGSNYNRLNGTLINLTTTNWPYPGPSDGLLQSLFLIFII